MDVARGLLEQPEVRLGEKSSGQFQCQFLP